MGKFLQTHKQKILGPNGKFVVLKGVNFGGWLMMEAYILHAANFPARKFKREFADKLGSHTLRSFENSFCSNFIQESDFKNVKKLGFNCIRVPFNHSLIEKAPYQYDPQGLAYLDNVLRWAERAKVWVILDLHGAAGSQNSDWHSDSYGQAELWTIEEYRKRTYALWAFLAHRYKDKEWLAGYDLLNEAVLDDPKILNEFYREAIQAIRSVDRNHILFIEGSRWAQDLNSLDPISDNNYVLSIHSYEPLAFTFNFIPHLKYPLKSKQIVWNKTTTRKLLSQYAKISKTRQCPIYVGEFGVNYRNGFYNEHIWLKDTLSCFKEFGFHWTYWTYKSIKNSAFPDGLYSQYGNPPWVNRPGPLTGWDTYKLYWPHKSKDMIRSWHTDQFQINPHIQKALQDAL